MMTEEKSPFDEFENNSAVRRRSLLPLWIKVFIWFFLIGGVGAVLVLLAGMLLTNINLSLYGITALHPYTTEGFIISILMLFKGIVAYGLWYERKWAPQLAIIDAITGIVICIIMMVIIPFTSDHIEFTVRLELIPLYLYLVKMQKIKTRWVNL